MSEENLHNDYVIKAILRDKEYAITEVNNLQSLKYMILDREQYSNIESLIKKHDWQALSDLKDNLPLDGFYEYLDILKFNDQKQRIFVVTIYDSEELWQDPQLIDLFLIDK